MDSAKRAVKNFLHRSGKDETDVQKKFAPAVTHENIERQHHEVVTTAVDREIHQDHYHTTVQPIIADTEVLPEQHHYRVAPTTHREFDHGTDVTEDQRKAHAEAAKFQNQVTHSEAPVTTETSTETVVEGTTHIHHHVYETVQPVIEKKVIERHVIHTTVPIHETHHNPAEYHDASTLPAVSMDHFQQRQGGTLTGENGERATSGLQSEQRAVEESLKGLHIGPGGQASTQTGANTGVATSTATGGTHSSGAGAASSLGTGVAGNAAISAARAAALGGQRLA